MTKLDQLATVDPAERDEIPRCWVEQARGFGGEFVFGPTTRPWNWIELDAEEADQLFTLLENFVAYFNARYGEHPERRIPPCWAEHGALVEELTTLFWARWQAFQSPHGSIGGAQYWHSYTLPSFYERMARWLGDDLVPCQHGRHRDSEYVPIGTTRAWQLRTEVIASIDVVRRSSAAAVGRERPRIVVSFLERVQHDD